MLRVVTRSAAMFVISVLLPVAAYAQAAITGVVRDSSGAVLPGVTVEASSPVLIEKVRAVVTDGTGQYRVTNLRPGTYAVVYTLPGFNTVRRDGVELTGNFVATINVELRVGALEETITVTGETPIVDVQSAQVQQTLDANVLAAIPTSRNAAGIQALIPGMAGAGDTGGFSGGTGGTAQEIHGGRGNDARTYNDGINTGWAGGSGGGGNMVNIASAQEVVLNITAGLGEAETSGAVLNVIPREGSNTFSGTLIANGAPGAWQGSNYTQALQDAGLSSPQELRKIWDVNPMGGGRIVRDRVWFFLSWREWGSERTIPGMFHNRAAGDLNRWDVDFDLSDPAFDRNVNRNPIGRITIQATPRNKFNIHWSEQFNDAGMGRAGGSTSTTPEADFRTYYNPSHIAQATWSSPLSGRILLEAGWSMYQARYRFAPRTDGTSIPGIIRLINSPSNNVPNWAGGTLNSRAPQQNTHHLIGTLANTKASISFITGAHNMKFGYQGGFNNPSQEYNNYAQVEDVWARNGVPYRLRQNITFPFNIKYVRNLHPHSFYAQDQFTYDRLTLQGGVRFDQYRSSYPDSRVGGPGYPNAPNEIFFPRRSTPGYDWRDVTPRFGMAYDLFGTGRTAVKFNIGKYMEAITASNNDLDMNPLIRTVVSTTRSWEDANADYIVNCDLNNYGANGECGALDNANLGQPVFNRTFDLGFVHGWGTRPYNWTMGASIQQEIIPRVSATVSYNRRWFGNQYTVDNRATASSDYTPYFVTAPLDPRLPGGGGYQVGPFYDINPDKQGAVDELATHTSNFGEYIENWHGVDVNLRARLRNGLTLQGGTSTGRRLTDTCSLRAVLPETYEPGNDEPGLVNPYCRVEEPFRTSVRGLVAYTIPRVDVQVSGTWSSEPGDSLAANWRARNNDVRPSLGRNLTEASSVSLNLIEPYTVFEDRQNNVDFRVAKILRYGRTRTQIGLDLYNLTNRSTPTSVSSTFSPGGSWLVPRGIPPARYAKVSAQIDF